MPPSEHPELYERLRYSNIESKRVTSEIDVFLPPSEQWKASLPLRPKVPDRSPEPRKNHIKMGSTKLGLFKGLKDGREDPEEFTEDLEWTYTQDYESNEPETSTSKDAYKSKTFRILFRNHLEGKASSWYLDLDSSLKLDWERLSGEFKKFYKLTPKDSQTRRFELKVQLHNLEQEKDENIADYLERAEELYAQLPTDDIDIGIAVLKGMTHSSKKERVSFI